MESTVTIDEADAVQPKAELTVTVYTEVKAGETVIEELVSPLLQE